MPQRGPQIVLGEPKARVPNLNSAPLFFLRRAQPQFGRYRPADDTFHVFSHASSAHSGASRSLPRKVSLLGLSAQPQSPEPRVLRALRGPEEP